MALTVINISLPKELLKKVDQLAHQQNRTRSELFREAARRYLEARAHVALTWERTDSHAFAELSDPALRRIWDNEKDAAYDAWPPGKHVRRKA